MKPKKVLILGSGALKIGEAGEFDYSGSQAIKALKEERIETVLINPNIATIQTSEFLSDHVYFLPVNEYFVEEVIKKERPDAILLSFGGQTALNCGMSLYKKKILQKYGVQVLGTSVKTIDLSEDREKFANHLHKIGISTPQSEAATTVEGTIKIGEKIGYPLMVRAAFALGGQKSGVAQNEAELREIAGNAFAFSPQVLVEKYLHHFKEIEYEVVRDINDNCVTVCNMENMDPLGIHTGESIVVAPSQTLNNYEYHELRNISIKIARSLNIIGECNVQFAVNPHPKTGELEYYVIELNPRLSRSSALASKATGYPLAYVAAKLVLGKSLTEIKNQVTQVTQSCFEPALDYIVVKMPRWDLDKFDKVEQKIGSSMKSVGEVMAIGRTFEEALQKAVRMLDLGYEGVNSCEFPKDNEAFMTQLRIPTPKRLFVLAEAFKRGITVDELYDITGIDPWFLQRVKYIVNMLTTLTEVKKLKADLLLQAKQIGISDKQIASVRDMKEAEVRALRKKMGITPFVFQIDTMGGEVPAKTNYLYMTYNGGHHDVAPLGKKGVMVLGSGPYRIGSSVEFDWTCVNTAMHLKKYERKSIIVNCNPETVSTDYDISDRLFFEELSFERVSDIYDFENPEGVIISVGGQTPNNLAQKLDSTHINVLGTDPSDIDRAEDRSKFSALLDNLNIPQPYWNKFSTLDQVKEFAKKVGFPVLIRPSYVLSGSAMNICVNETELIEFINRAVVVSKEHPITVSKFMNNAKEVEFDGIAQDGEIMVQAISEHIENAGVHSGDADIVYPPQKIFLHTEKKIIETSQRIAKALKITGPFNIQYIAKKGEIFVIEVNVRASRTLPFISKATGVNFAEILVDALFHAAKPREISYPNYCVVKAPQFSFSRLEGADPILRVEMASTGEAACFGRTLEEAYLKAQISVGASIPKKGVFVSIGDEENKIRFMGSFLRLKALGLPIYATEKTAKFLKLNGVKAKVLYKLHEKKQPDVLSCFEKGLVDLAINITDHRYPKDIRDRYILRRVAVDHNISLFTNRHKASLFIKSLIENGLSKLQVKEWKEY
ncbi:carbamoyl-phosphate synthase (glutamine-hydrolyzing) large subunit [Candidatus Roizmanbacteria bacterium]|nr:carbamoyl-phosphate synthase (glutamine-hydrolyzing) large subunit [Candidatus Roizmanbacteria bacterium]